MEDIVQQCHPLAQAPTYYTTFSPQGQPRTNTIQSDQLQAADLQQPTRLPLSSGPPRTIWDELEKDANFDPSEQFRLTQELASFPVPTPGRLSGTLVSPLDNAKQNLPVQHEDPLEDISDVDIDVPQESPQAKARLRKY